MSQEGFDDENDPYYISDSDFVAYLEDYGAEAKTSYGNAGISQRPVNGKKIMTNDESLTTKQRTLNVTIPLKHKGEPQPQTRPICELDVATMSHNGTGKQRGVEPSLQVTTARSEGVVKRTWPFEYRTPKKPKNDPKTEGHMQNLNRECRIHYVSNTQHAHVPLDGSPVSIHPTSIKPLTNSNRKTPSQSKHANIIIMDIDKAQFRDIPLGGSHDAAQDSPPDGDTVKMIEPTALLQRISRRKRDFPKFNSVRHIDHFRFVNLDKIQSFEEAVDAVHIAIQSLLDQVMADVNPGDFVQLRLKGGHFLDHVFSSKHPHTDFKAKVFLNSVARSLHGNGECLGHGTLTLETTIKKNRRGGGKRQLKSIAYSQIIKQKRQWLYDFNNSNSNLCLAASIYALLADSNISDVLVMSRATQLHKDLSIPDDQLVSFSDISKFEKYLGINIKVLYHNEGSWQYFHTDSSTMGKNVYILHHDNHYYGIKSVKAFLGEAYFCQKCSTVFHHKNSHSCKYFCKACQRDDCTESATKKPKCPSCRVFCRSSECFEQHQRLAKDDKTFCKPKYFCDSCMRYAVNNVDHVCKGLTCNVCHVSLDQYASHLCHMQQYTPPDMTEKYIIFNYECQLEKNVQEPNFIYCTKLDGECTWEFEGKACLQEFVQFFTNGKFNGFTFITHDVGRYDIPFVIHALIKEKFQVKLLMQDHRLLCASLPDLNMRFIDFLNFLPVDFHSLPTAMGFPGITGYFPKSFNTEANQTYVGPLPAKEYYDVDYMTADDRKVFMAWYEEHKNTTFDLKSALISHCEQAVEVLRKACERYRGRVIETSTKQVEKYCKLRKKYFGTLECVDPFQLISCPAVCMAMYRFNFLPKDTIAILPSDNYHKTQKRASTPSIQWLMYTAHTENITIQHALNGGEKRVGKYSLDGYAHINGQDVAFEFFWCFCKNNDGKDVLKSHYCQTYQNFLTKKQYLLRCGFTVRAIWEHEWNKILEKDGDLQDFLHKKKAPTSLQARDALYGGITETITLYRKAGPGETIHHYQYTGLYPFVSKTKRYPVGHPEIILEKFGPFSQYFGIAKVKIYPPRGLFFPVLPMKIYEKVLYTLCYTCAVNLQGQPCSHSDEERSLTGTWCTIELQMAVEKGYRIGHIYEIWNFPNTTDELFAPYINLHRRDHQEALGYPSWCTDDNKKKQYIDAFLEKEGIQLRADCIMADLAKRNLSDLFINSLWGKFGQRSNLPQTSIVTDPDELFRYVFQPSYDVSVLNFIDDETAAVNWRFTKGHHMASKNANVVIASFTMAHARLQRFRLLDRLQERCLYYDADSVIFVSKDGEWNPPLGDHLGELTSKVPNGTHITEFTLVGLDTYSYRLDSGEAIFKVKGLTL
ncbi:uncharacterized protein LOC122946097 isoform X2 [Bufo gargarizans]|nr:uncharacterized protein LOC122946097 isoform X2 [Bufo gargarizans]XP_044161371.1 uncharacterized protein LOC122946097 isoform X2 [Bufo gargarizans]